MENLYYVLKKLGMNPKEAKIYLTCLEFDGATIGLIHKRTAIPRSTIYDSAYKLINGGYLTATKKGGVKNFFAISPKHLTVLLEDKKIEISKKQKLLSDNLGVFESIKKGLGNIPQIQYFQGKEALSHIYDQIQYSTTMKTLFNPELVEKYGKLLDEKIIETQNAKKIKTYALLPNNEYALHYAQKNSSKYISFRFLDAGQKLECDTILLDRKYFHISFGDTLYALEIINDIFLQTQHILFDSVWRSKPPVLPEDLKV